MIYRPHHYMLYELNPNYESEDGRVRHNGYGVRGKEFLLEKADGVYRIVCMGESSTYCVFLKESETYPVRLEFYLKEAGLDVEVINAGIPGYTSAENLMYFIFKIQELKPDLIIYYYTHNDVHPRRLPHLSRDYREYSKSWEFNQSWIRLLFSNIFTVFKKKKEVNIANVTRRYGEYVERKSVNVLKNSPSYFRDNIKSLALLVQGFGIQLLFVNPQYKDLDKFEKKNYSLDEIDLMNLKDLKDLNPVYFAVYQHRVIIEGICKEVCAGLFDLRGKIPYPVVKPGQKSSNEYYLDAVHFTAKGADRIAHLLVEPIFCLRSKKVLKKNMKEYMKE